MHFYDPKGKLKERSNFQRLMSIKKVTSVNDAVSKINYFSKDLETYLFLGHLSWDVLALLARHLSGNLKNKQILK